MCAYRGRAMRGQRRRAASEETQSADLFIWTSNKFLLLKLPSLWNFIMVDPENPCKGCFETHTLRTDFFVICITRWEDGRVCGFKAAQCVCHSLWEDTGLKLELFTWGHGLTQQEEHRLRLQIQVLSCTRWVGLVRAVRRLSLGLLSCATQMSCTHVVN